MAGPSETPQTLDLALVLHLLQFGEQVIAELRELDVVGHVEVDVVDAQALERLLQGLAHELRARSPACARGASRASPGSE